MPRIFAKCIILASLMLLWTPMSGAQDGIIDAPTAHRMLQAGSVTLIDIRRPSEWSVSGIPAGASAITMHDPGGPTEFLSAVLAAVGGDRAAPIALICATGIRSSWATSFLAAQGFTGVYNVREGVMGRGSQPGWIRQGLPMEDAPD